MKAQDLIKLNRPPTILLYGPAGSGKTALVAQAAKSYMFDFDGGMRTALTLKDKFSPLRQSIDFDTYIDADPLRPSAFVTAKRKLMEIANLVNSGKWSYDGVIIDSLTGLCRSAQLSVLSMGANGNALGIPQIQHYGMMVNEVESVLTILRSMKCLVVVTAHEMLVETDDNTSIQIMSATRSHGMNRIPWLFDEVWHSYTRALGQGKFGYYITGQGGRAVVTRTRSGIGELDVGSLGLYEALKKLEYEYLPAKVI